MKLISQKKLILALEINYRIPKPKILAKKKSMPSQLNKKQVGKCSPEILKSKLTVDYQYCPTFRMDEETNTWYCGSPRSTYVIEREMFSEIYEITYGESTPRMCTNDDPVEKYRQEFLKQMKIIPGRVETDWCSNLTDENLEMWCTHAVEIFNKL